MLPKRTVRKENSLDLLTISYYNKRWYLHPAPTEGSVLCGSGFSIPDAQKDYILDIKVTLNNDVVAIQIGIADFTLFKEEPEFYSTYMLRNMKTGQVYTDKFRLQILDLKNVVMATEEDRRWKIDKWARFFKATTWKPDNVSACTLGGCVIGIRRDLVRYKLVYI